MQKVIKKYFALILLNLIVSVVFAQNEAITEPQLMYYQRQQYGMNINSTGLGGINFKYGWHKTGTINNILDIEFARIRHYKETRIPSTASSSGSRSYTYGRLNMAFFLRTGYGQNIEITERVYKNAVSLHFNYSVGVTTAILKPVYYDVQKIINDPYQISIVRVEKFDPANPQDQGVILGNSAFTYGLNELNFIPGGYGRASLAIEWGAYPDEFKSIEAGVVVDLFPKPLPLMAFTSAESVFVGLFLEFTIGKNN